MYYYSLTNHTSAGVFDSSQWAGNLSLNGVTKPFFPFVASYGSPTNLNPKVKQISFGDNFSQRFPDGLNSFLLEFDLTFENRDLAENTAINHFLMRRSGVESFFYTPPNPWNLTKIFICGSWTSVPVYQNNYTLKIKLTEVPN